MAEEENVQAMDTSVNSEIEEVVSKEVVSEDVNEVTKETAEEDSTEKVDTELTDDALLVEGSEDRTGDIEEQEDDNAEDGADELSLGLDESKLDEDDEAAKAVDDEDTSKVVDDDEANKEDEDYDDEEAEEEEDEDEKTEKHKNDPNVMPQVNVQILAKRRWQVKVYPLKPADFVSGQISRVFKNAKESLLYILSPGRFARGKGEMYISSVNQAVKVVSNLMKLDFQYPEINIEIIRKSDDGVIEEKAYMRFDTKLVRMLSVPIHPARRLGSKRERIIGSVFVKNLPVGTSKDMLRVLFPFAPEINYNPEKFKDCVARLVLNNRNAVIPCLKAFAKIDLGGNVLELHPLEKRKKLNDEEALPSSSAKRHSRSESSTEKKKEEGKKESSETKSGGGDKTSKSPVAKKETKATPVKKEPPKPKPAPAKSGSNSTKPTGTSKTADDKDKLRKHILGQKKAGLVVAEDKRKTGPAGSRFAAAKRFSSTSQMREQRGKPVGNKFTPRRDTGDRRPNVKRESGGFNRPSTTAGRNNMGSSRGVGRARGRGRFVSTGGFGRRTNRAFDDRGRLGALSRPSPAIEVEAKATKDMMVLQSQLSMAIKNQIAMLNQTQMAVEHAKMSAGNLSRGAGSSGYDQSASQRRTNSRRERQFVQKSRSRDRGAPIETIGSVPRGFGNKRSAVAAGFAQDSFSMEDSYSKRRNSGGFGGGQQSQAWSDDTADLYGRQVGFGYGASSLQEEDTFDQRRGNMNVGGFSSYGDSQSYGYRY